MFNKREQQESDAATRAESASQPADRAQAAAGTPPRPAGGSAHAAIIGPSISIDGQLKGEEDLIIEGRIKGTVQLKKNTLTVGTQGTVDAEVYAHTIQVDGTVNGDLYASERISIRKSARIKGNIMAPRVSLEDGAKFRGSIDMDADSEAYRKAFGSKAGAASGAAASAAKASNDSKAETGKTGNSPAPSSGTGAGSASQGSGQKGKAGNSAA